MHLAFQHREKKTTLLVHGEPSEFIKSQCTLGFYQWGEMGEGLNNAIFLMFYMIGTKSLIQLLNLD